MGGQGGEPFAPHNPQKNRDRLLSWGKKEKRGGHLTGTNYQERVAREHTQSKGFEGPPRSKRRDILQK